MAGETSTTVVPVVGSIILGFFTLVGVFIQNRRRPSEDDKDLDVIVSLSEAWSAEKDKNRDLERDVEAWRLRAEACEAREEHGDEQP